MTTGAYKNGVLAFDSLITCGNSRSGHIIKGIKTERHLAMAAGDIEHIQDFLNWVKGGCKKRKLKASEDMNDPSFEGFTVNRRGVITVYGVNGVGVRVTPIGGCFAVGSGGSYAMGAMLAGKSAMDAVRVAIRCDSGSGGAVRFVTFSDNEKGSTAGDTGL